MTITLKAKKEIQYTVYSFTCPNCNEAIENPETGSVDWFSQELKQYIEKHNHVVKCQYCGTNARI
jgi:Zn finger protein HypA/HybF involved in hydrogenase expression